MGVMLVSFLLPVVQARRQIGARFPHQCRLISPFAGMSYSTRSVRDAAALPRRRQLSAG